MQAQIITYQLHDISQVEYLKQMVEPDAPILAKVKGLISKVWLSDIEKNSFGGFYLWENETAFLRKYWIKYFSLSLPLNQQDKELVWV